MAKELGWSGTTKREEIPKAPLEPISEWEERLEKQAEHILGEALDFFLNYLSTNPGYYRMKMEPIIKKELASPGLRNATFCLGLLDAVLKFLYEDRERVVAAKEADMAVDESSLELRKNQIGVLIALREFLASRHDALENLSWPYTNLNDTEGKFFVNPEMVTRDRLFSWIEGYKLRVKHFLKGPESGAQTGPKMKTRVELEKELLLLDLFLLHFDRVQPKHLEDMEAILEDEIYGDIDRIKVLLQQYSENNSLEKDLIFLERRVEEKRQLIALLEGRKAEARVL